MASSFTLNSGSYNGRYLQLYCSQSKDIATNRSKITWTLSAIGGTSNYYGTGPTSVTIAGQQVYNKSRVNWEARVFPAAKGSVSGTIYVDHDSAGNKSISVSFTTAIYVGNTSTYSGTWTLDNIPRQAELTSAPNFTDLENPTIYYKNPAGNSVSELMACISLTGAKDDIKYRNISKTGTSYQFPLTDAERDLLRNNTTSGRRKVQFFVRTLIGGKYYHSAQEKELSIVENDDTRPTVTMTAELNNGSLPSIFDGIYIQGKSRLDVNISAQGKYSANILSYSANIGGEVYNSDSFLSNVLNKEGKVDVIGYAKDSRGFTGSNTKQIDVAPYSKPLVIPLGSETAIQCYRSDGNGKRVGNSTSVWVKAKRSYYSLSGKNRCEFLWRKKLVTDAWDDSSHEWHSLIHMQNTTTDEYNALLPNEEFDLRKSYSVQIAVVDDIGEYDIKDFEIPTQDVALHLGKGGKNVSIGTYCNYSKEHTFYSAWDAYFDKDIYVGDNKIVDFIVEQGESGIWTYRKWASGIAECWGRLTSITTPPWSNTQAMAYVLLPFAFVDNPIAACSGGQYGSAASYIMHTDVAPTAITSYMHCSVEPSESEYCWFDFQIKGRWKY